MSSALSELRCVYCDQLISADDDAQRIERKKYAHTTCAFDADEQYFLARDEQSEQ